MSFGPHLLIEGRKCDPEKIKDLGLVSKFMSELPERVGMTKIAPPYVFHYAGKVPEDSGITGMTIIAESHISIHIFEKKDYIFFDLFSCKPFNTDKVVEIFINTFGVSDITWRVEERGLDFPRG